MAHVLERKEKELGCLRVLTEITKYLDLIEGTTLPNNPCKLEIVANSKHNVVVEVISPSVANNNRSEIFIDVINDRSGLLAHRLWFALETSPIQKVYYGYSTPYFRGAAKTEDRAGTMVVEVEHICPLRLLDNYCVSDSVLDTLYDALPSVYAFVVPLFE